MSNLTKDDIKRLANLARLSVPEEEMDSVAQDIDTILGFVDTIQSVQLGDQVADIQDEVNVFREDTVNPLTPEYDLIEAAPLHQDHFVKVPKVIE
ncbi:MAG TPA: Asp-tRNA(Asn)/Glu-tRNA(Gln) amidotransferase subunit GatC [Candidatus Paceibacterota bacterium]|jgi:aspartyl-tRNA(Asn)/glutamyl-tRNA(Gln) amidotransferase subunit C|nr:Asp-tRNA(Asn)/Glu-tRNA(Gln) amidotransferase subunit GatC [Candidatus Paceibacterota bacterium]